MDWEERYQNHGRCFGNKPTPYLRDALPSLCEGHRRPLTLLFPGDGYGRNGIWAAQQGYEVEAFDLSPAAVTIGQQDGKGYTYSTRVLDPCRQPWPWAPNSFDGICIVWCRIEDADKRREVNAKLFETLRPGGFVLIVSSTRVTSFEDEQQEWSSGLTWTKQNQGDALLMIGRRRPNL